jgi:hypothetical protein
MRAIRACASLAALTTGVVVASAIPAHADEPSATASASVSVDVGADANLSVSLSGLLDLILHLDISIG